LSGNLIPVFHTALQRPCPLNPAKGYEDPVAQGLLMDHSVSQCICSSHFTPQNTEHNSYAKASVER